MTVTPETIAELRWMLEEARHEHTGNWKRLQLGELAQRHLPSLLAELERPGEWETERVAEQLDRVLGVGNDAARLLRRYARQGVAADEPQISDSEFLKRIDAEQLRRRASRQDVAAPSSAEAMRAFHAQELNAARDVADVRVESMRESAAKEIEIQMPGPRGVAIATIIRAIRIEEPKP